VDWDDLKSLFSPSLEVRLRWWFGIYFVAQLPLVLYVAFEPLFPMGLLGLWLSPKDLNIYFQTILLYSYAFYIAHLILSLSLPSKRAFRILMVILIAAVLLNLAGCMTMVPKDGQAIN
jgi:hypothetical protein